MQEEADDLGVFIPDRIVEQINVFAESSSEAGSSEPGATDTIYAATTAGGKPAGAPQPSALAQHSDTTEFDLVESSGETGHSRSREIGTTSAPLIWQARSLLVFVDLLSLHAKHTTKSELAVMDDARPPGIAKYGATSESELAESAGEAGSFCPGATSTTSAGDIRVAKPPGLNDER